MANCATSSHAPLSLHRPTLALMGWVTLGLLAVAAALVLWRSGVHRALWPLVGAALMLGGVGYAWQNRADLPGHPVVADRTPLDVPEEEVALRDAMLGRFTGDGAYLIASDGLFRGGRVESGTRVILLGIGHYPRSLTLWTGLGSALARHDGGNVSPAARLAFLHAAQLAPLHPAPPFFAGLAEIRAGNLAGARVYWARALALTPHGLSYRRDIALRLALLDRFIAETGGAPPVP